MTPTTHPLVAAYLEELDRLLAGIDPGDRAEVMAGVREHLDTALPGSDPVTDDDVRTALAELGPPHAVADEAYAGKPPAVTPPVPRVGPMSRVWVPILVVILQVIALLFVLIIVGGFPAVSTAGVDGVEVPGSAELTGNPLFGSLAAIMFTLPLWATVALLVGTVPAVGGPREGSRGPTDPGRGPADGHPAAARLLAGRGQRGIRRHLDSGGPHHPRRRLADDPTHPPSGRPGRMTRRAGSCERVSGVRGGRW